MAKQQYPETKLQIACVKLLRLLIPRDAKILMLKNGGQRSDFMRMQDKLMGEEAGAADIAISYMGINYFVEFKAKGNSLSESQKDFRDWCERNKTHWAMINDIDKIKDMVTRFGLDKLREAEGEILAQETKANMEKTKDLEFGDAMQELATLDKL